MKSQLWKSIPCEEIEWWFCLKFVKGERIYSGMHETGVCPVAPCARDRHVSSGSCLPAPVKLVSFVKWLIFGVGSILSSSPVFACLITKHNYVAWKILHEYHFHMSAKKVNDGRSSSQLSSPRRRVQYTLMVLHFVILKYTSFCCYGCHGDGLIFYFNYLFLLNIVSFQEDLTGLTPNCSECWFSFFIRMIDVGLTFRGRSRAVRHVDRFNSWTWRTASPLPLAYCWWVSK